MFGAIIIVSMVVGILLLRVLLPIDVQTHGSSVSAIEQCPPHKWEYFGNNLKCSICRKSTEEIIGRL